MNVLYFTAGWCAPCKAFKPVVNQVAFQTGLNIQYIDVDASKEAAAKHQITSVPTLLIQKNGVEVDRRSGAMSVTDLERFFAKHR